MENIAVIIVMTIVLLVLAGVIIFLIQDYLKYKETTDESLVTNKKGIEDEKTTRLSNLKYVVDSVNTINNDIYRQFTTSSNEMQTKFAGLSNNQQRGLSAFGSFMEFRSNINVDTPPNLTLFDMPGATAPDVRLIKHVTMINGLNIKEIGSNQFIDNVMFCNKGATRCIKFPDQDGNTVLTSMKLGSRIVLDSDSDIQGTVNLKSSGPTSLSYGIIDGVASGTGTNMRISASNNLLLNPYGNVGITKSASFPLTAMLHIDAAFPTAGDGFRVSCPNNKSVWIDNTGTLNVEKIKVGTSTIEQDSRGKLLITAESGITVSTPTNNTTFNNNVVITAPSTLNGRQP